jgi:hypothetical protein
MYLPLKLRSVWLFPALLGSVKLGARCPTFANLGALGAGAFLLAVAANEKATKPQTATAEPSHATFFVIIDPPRGDMPAYVLG